MLSFVTARTYATLFPSHVLLTGGINIHHFWFGLVFLAVEGWLGINYNDKNISISAAILYVVGGGLIVNEVGLILTFGNYLSGLTWAPVLIVPLAFTSMLILIFRNSEKIPEELGEFATRKLALVAAFFLAVTSAAFIAETIFFWVRVA